MAFQISKTNTGPAYNMKKIIIINDDTFYIHGF